MCCLADFDALLATEAHDLHGEYFFVPGLHREFTAAEIAALMAPRLHLCGVGRNDPLTPPAGVEAVDQVLRTAYGALGRPGGWCPHVFDAGHAEVPAMRALVLEALTRLRDRTEGQPGGIPPAIE